jgi:colanic acid/amylovoran/stewartan biosynthesis glycosyltransferase WcaL/AmsK/CpsK
LNLLQMNQNQRVTVMHSVHRWLPQTETWLYNQVRHLPANVHSHIFCEATSNLDQFALPNIHSLEDAPRPRQFWDRQLRKLRVRRHFGFLVVQARRCNAQILHSHFGNAGWSNLEAARMARLKHVVTYYGYDVGMLPKQDPRWLPRYRDLFANVDRVLCEGPYMGQCIVALGCPEEKLRVHHLGVGIEEIAFRPRQWTSGEPLRVLIAASFREKKGIPYGLEALGQFQGQIPVEITIIGDASRQTRSQEEKKKILTTIERYNLGAKVRLMGYQPYARVFDEAYRHHLFISPSVTASDGDSEGGAPLGIIEMAATGMPIISTRHCDIPSVIKDRVTGFLAEERSVSGIIDGIQWWIDQPQQWCAILEAARKHIEQQFDARKQGQRLSSIYFELKSNECAASKY